MLKSYALSGNSFINSMQSIKCTLFFISSPSQPQYLSAAHFTIVGFLVAKVSLVWFTGDEKKVTSIEGFDLRDVTLSPGKRFAFLVGSTGECLSGLTVDTVTGEVLQTVPKANGPVQLWWRPSERFFNLEKLMEGIE